ncbi:MAG: alpha/beta hydrolase fold domain-containing protein [Salinivirgaceae bacterium]|nr:alpha/beta hydrolase fold domain-containing protein [Salinivirgaceae bacterium]
MKLTFTIALTALSLCAFSQQEIRLYDGVAPGSEGVANNEKVQRDANGQIQTIFGVVEPSITVFLPEAEKSTGVAVILCAGGALAAHSWGDNVVSMAEWLNERGIAAIGLKYRTRTNVGPRPQTGKPLNVTITEFDQLQKSNANPDQSGATDASIGNAIDDALRAMEIVRQNADKWRIDTAKIGYLGFSAGGGVAIGATLLADNQHRAAFIATIFGPSLIDVNVPQNAPKLFIATRSNHKNVAAGLLSLYLDWKKAGANAEMHFYDDGAGPFGSGDTGNTSSTWRENFYRWLTFNF